MNNGGTSLIRDDAVAAGAVERSPLRVLHKGEDDGDCHHGKKEEGVRGKAWAQTLAGAMAGAVSRAAVTPLDVAKIRLQLQVEGPQHARYRGTWHCLSSMVKAEGLGSLWRGHVASQMLSVSYCAIQVRRSPRTRRQRERREENPLPFLSALVLPSSVETNMRGASDRRSETLSVIWRLHGIMCLGNMLQ